MGFRMGAVDIPEAPATARLGRALFQTVSNVPDWLRRRAIDAPGVSRYAIQISSISQKGAVGDGGLIGQYAQVGDEKTNNMPTRTVVWNAACRTATNLLRALFAE